jgi:hypothetical protein
VEKREDDEEDEPVCEEDEGEAEEDDGQGEDHHGLCDCVAAPSPSHPLENPVDFSPGERVKDKHRRYCMYMFDSHLK